MTLLAKDIMTRAPKSIPLRATLAEAKKVMSTRRIRHLPVTDRGRPVGILSDRDLTVAAGVYKHQDYDHKVTVEDVCLFEPYTIEESTPLTTVLKEMARRKIGSALITKDGSLTGIITTVDICLALAEALRSR